MVSSFAAPSQRGFRVVDPAGCGVATWRSRRESPSRSAWSAGSWPAAATLDLGGGWRVGAGAGGTGSAGAAYDKAGDEHDGVVRAFIKSMRGSDPDAAAYWMTRMPEAGEEPRFVPRRMVIFAAEDIGNADPQALVVATAALSAFERVGLPDGVLPLTQAAVYLDCAPKSNPSLTTYAAARKAVREHGALPVPVPNRRDLVSCRGSTWVLRIDKRGVRHDSELRNETTR